MNEEKLMKAIGYIDDELIQETKKARKKKNIPVYKIGLVAACIVLIVCMIPIILPFLSEKSVQENADDIEQVTTENNSDKTPSDELYNSSTPPAVSDDDNEGKIENEMVIPDQVVACVPMQLTVKEFTNSGFICTVFDNRGNDAFRNGDTITVIFSEDLNVPEKLSKEDTVYVTFSVDKSKAKTIIAHKIEYFAGDTTPALFGGKL